MLSKRDQKRHTVIYKNNQICEFSYKIYVLYHTKVQPLTYILECIDVCKLVIIFDWRLSLEPSYNTLGCLVILPDMDLPSSIPKNYRNKGERDLQMSPLSNIVCCTQIQFDPLDMKNEFQYRQKSIRLFLH